MNRLLFFLSAILLCAGCSQKEEVKVDFRPVQDYVVNKLSQTITELELMRSTAGTEASLVHFKKARHAFKAAEPFAEYLNADNVHKINGPPLPLFKEDNGKVLEPVSLQAIDEQLFSGEPVDTAMLGYRVYVLTGYLNNLKNSAEMRAMNPQRFFVPIHQQFLRIFTLSTISFDTPSSLQGLQDAIISLESIRDVYTLSIADTVRYLDAELHERFMDDLSDAIEYLNDNGDFNEFNRYEFGRKFLNALTRSWVEIRQTTGLYDDPKIYAINMDAPTFFEKDGFNVMYFRSSYNKKPTSEEITLGESLFFDKRLSASGNLSCATCHDPGKAYQDGLPLGMDKEGEQLKRNTPTLINSVFQKKFFWDGRSESLEQQISVVFETEEEFDHAGHSISLDILEDTALVEKLRSVYQKENPSRNEIVKALASFTSTLYSFDSRFDRNMRGESDDFSEEEIRGMNLFMGKALCATCHFIPLTNGTVPPGFYETEKEILGTPETSENLEVDDDLGFYWVFKEDIHKYMFKTPSIRNIQHTAPYMHNGVYETLEEVMNFYNKGGGGGMGFDLEHQTLPFDSLGLNDSEIESIIAFMKTFSDVSNEYPESVNVASLE